MIDSRIIGSKIDLKPIDQGDLELLRIWRNKYSQHFYSQTHIDKAHQKAWYAHYVDQCGKDFMFLIQLKDGTPIGTIAMYDINVLDRTAELGRILLIEGHRGKGYMEEAIELLKQRAFTNLKLYKLTLSTYLDNVSSISLYNRVGFESLHRPTITLECKNYEMIKEEDPETL